MVWPYPSAPPDGFSLVVKQLLVILIPILFIISILGIWYLKREIARKTKHLEDEISGRRQAQEKIRVSEIKYKKLFEVLPVGITVSDNAGNIVESNAVGEDILNISKEEFSKKNIDGEDWGIIKTDGSPMLSDDYASTRALKENRLISNVEMGLARGADDVTWINVTATPIPLEGYGVVIAYIDISDRKKAEDQIKSSLEEKKTLLKELYHRTKNNMQVIIAMISLQTQNIEDEAILSMFNDTINRISTMALVHEKLYQTKNLSEINLKEYFTDLIELLISDYPGISEQITVQYEMEPIMVTIDTAIPCGLIMNELLSNVFKHAFPENQPGEIQIHLKEKDDGIDLRFKDNGVGLPEGFDCKETESMGIKTIMALAEHQMGGTISFINNKGVACQINFDGQSQ
jgi:PAS domain S-box-containing protein